MNISVPDNLTMPEAQEALRRVSMDKAASNLCQQLFPYPEYNDSHCVGRTAADGLVLYVYMREREYCGPTPQTFCGYTVFWKWLP